MHSYLALTLTPPHVLSLQVSCVIELLQADPNVAHHLWVLLFPIVWSSLHKDQQTALAKPIIQLLSKEHQTHQVCGGDIWGTNQLGYNPMGQLKAHPAEGTPS